LYRGHAIETVQGSEELLKQHFPSGTYQDVKGLCRAATLEEIEAQGWSLNPGRYVGVADGEEDDVDFYERLAKFGEELERLNREADIMQSSIAKCISKILSYE